MTRPDELIAALGLQAHPEGGWYTPVYRSPDLVQPLPAEEGRPERSAVTVIHFLLKAGEKSRWHLVRSDEVWQHIEGDPLELLVVPGTGGALERHLLGPFDAAAKTRPVVVVEADAWQAARPLGAYTLVSCVVAPGFDFDDFALLADQPEALEWLGPWIGEDRRLV